MGGKYAWTERPSGLRLRVRLTPKASRDCIEGTSETAEGPAVAARVRAVPEDGKANAAVEGLIADWLGQPRSRVTLTSGHKSRVKLLDIAGNPADLAIHIDMLLAVGPQQKKKGRTT